MKTFYSYLLAIGLLMTAQISFAQNVAINKDGSAPNASAMLDISANDAGLLTPRMTSAQKNAIASPATGLLIFQTDGQSGFKYYNGSTWSAISANQKSETFMFGKDRSEPFVKIENGSYEELGSFIFRGTNSIGTPTAFKVISYSEHATDPYNIKIFDSTNGNTIAEKTGIFGETVQIYDLGTISNLPSGEAIFQILGYKSAGGKGRLQSLNIQY